MNVSIRARLTLWYTALLAGALILFAVTVYLVMQNALQSNLDATLRDRLHQVGGEVKDTEGRLSLRTQEEALDLPAIPVALLSPSGGLVQGTLPTPLRAWVRQHASALPGGTSLSSVDGVRLGTSRIVRRQDQTAGYILVWESIRSEEDARHSLLLIMIASGPVLLLMAGFGGLLLASRALRPVADITQTAAAISGSDLQRRVVVGKAQDELSELSTTFNAMIDRLERAVDRERRFTADASHELRSPLAVIRAEATLTLERDRSAEEYRQALGAIDEQASTMEALIAALLALARTETAQELVRVPSPLADLVQGAWQGALPAAGAKAVHFDCRVPEGLLVEGAAPLLIQAIRNVLENAAKFSPPNGTIRVRGLQEEGQAVLTVGDEGPGVRPEDRERIFEPFYQASQARTPGQSHGLGLAICRRILAAHGGEIVLAESPGPGARFRIVLPLCTAAE